MQCEICKRDNLSAKELAVHKKYFHRYVEYIVPPSSSQKMASGACPECGAMLVHQEGCVSCQACGYSKCE